MAWTGSRAKLQCDPMDKALGRATLRYTFGCSCGLRLFSARCGVSEAAWTFDTVLASISSDGLTITSPFFATQPDGWWIRGEAYHPALDVRQDIVGHVGNAVTLRLPFPGAAVADAIKVIRGCDHLWKRSDGSWGDCHSVYGNAVNFGGDPFIPAKNPFASGLDG
ncbi:phage BR0599 family protein [Geothrix sp. PMB-07]|uniref:phage BR0599 family protein n=1 Tax=Geothrix sp. PMB-07 TaxID=3068640 RepID=UPI0027408723|nr:phage BR0599 family protein [Geothrix sp. PMB-07]WLT32834.1 phage BR0599 family protein [Geothrix sp. PMB-07]